MFDRIKAFYAQADVNTSRQDNVDLAKVFAIAFMILIHLMMYPEYQSLQTTFGWIADSFLGGFMAAPVFMFAMGVGLAFSRNNDSGKIIKRGVKIFLLNYLLNVARSISILVSLGLEKADTLEYSLNLFSGDILSFAGLAMISFGLLKKLKHANIIIPVVGIACNLVVGCFRGIFCNNATICLVAGLFVPVGYGDTGEVFSYFPLLTWFVIVGIGYVFGITVRKIRNLDNFYTWSIFAGALVLAVTMTLELTLNFGQLMCDNDFSGYRKLPIDVLLELGFVFLEFGCFHFLTKKSSQKLRNFIFTVSDAVNEIYIISWILILDVWYALYLFIFKGNHPDGYAIQWYLLGFAIITAISIRLAISWKKSKRRHP